MRTVFIYALCEPGTRTVRYIGKTQNLRRRFTDHLRVSSKTKTHLGHWLLSLSEPPNMVTLNDRPTGDGSAEEIRYIRVARMLGMDLCNATDGGDGVTMTTEIRAKIGTGNRGRKASGETRLKMSLSRIGKNPSPETREKHRINNVGRKHSAGTVEKIKARTVDWLRANPHPMSGKHHSPQTRAKISRSLSGENHPLFGKRRSEETRVRMSLARKAWWVRRKTNS